MSLNSKYDDISLTKSVYNRLAVTSSHDKNVGSGPDYDINVVAFMFHMNDAKYKVHTLVLVYFQIWEPR